MLLTYELDEKADRNRKRTGRSDDAAFPRAGKKNFLAACLEPSSSTFVSLPMCILVNGLKNPLARPPLIRRVARYERDHQETAEPLGFEVNQGAFGLVADKKGRDGGGDETSRRKKPGGPESHVANALKTAYEDAVRENVPDEFIGLLGKLT
jgi:hypothetical protein